MAQNVGNIVVEVTGASGGITPNLASAIDGAERSAGVAASFASALAAPIAATRFSFFSAASQGALLFTSFRSDQVQQMDLFVSFDGTTLTRINTDPVYGDPDQSNPPTAPNLGVRDPAIVQWIDGNYYVFYTLGFATHAIGIAKSVDLVKWDYVGKLEFAVAPNANTKLAWAPRPFVDPATGSLYLETALSDNADGGVATHYMTYRKLTGPAPSGNQSDWGPATSYGYGFNYIDAATYVEGGKYIQLVKNETTKYIERWESATYPNPGGWSKVGADNWTGWGRPWEAPRAIYFKGQWHVYLDPFDGQRYFHSTAPALSGPWTAPTQIAVGGVPIRHFNPLIIDTDVRKNTVADAIGGLAKIALTSQIEYFARYILDAQTREAQSITSDVDAPFASTFMRVRAQGDYAVFQARKRNANGYGVDFVNWQNRGYSSVSVVTNNVSKDAIRFDATTAKVDVPQGFTPLPLGGVSSFSNGWAQATIAPAALKTRTGVVTLSGNVSRPETPTLNETIMTLDDAIRPKRTQVFAVSANDTGIATIGVTVDGKIIYLSGGNTKIDFSGITFMASDAVA